MLVKVKVPRRLRPVDTVAFAAKDGRVGIIIGLPKPAGVNAYNTVIHTRHGEARVVVACMPDKTLELLTGSFCGFLPMEKLVFLLGNLAPGCREPNIGTKLANYVASLKT